MYLYDSQQSTFIKTLNILVLCCCIKCQYYSMKYETTQRDITEKAHNIWKASVISLSNHSPGSPLNPHPTQLKALCQEEHHSGTQLWNIEPTLLKLTQLSSTMGQSQDACLGFWYYPNSQEYIAWISLMFPTFPFLSFPYSLQWIPGKTQ